MFLGTFSQKVLKERLEENTSERLRLRAAVEYNVGMLRFYRYATAWTTAILLLKQSTGKKNLARALFMVGVFIPLPTPSLSNAQQSARSPRVQRALLLRIRLVAMLQGRRL